MYIEVIRQIDALNRYKWRFDFDISWNQRFALDFYAKQTRRTTRCQWIDEWETTFLRLDHRKGRIKFPEVPLSEDIIEEAKQKLKEVIDKMELSNKNEN